MQQLPSWLIVHQRLRSLFNTRLICAKAVAKGL
jgi:hypothetical protein